MNLITHALTTLTAALTLVISSQSFASKEPSSYSVAQIKNQQSTPELLTRLKSNVSNKQSSLILQKTQNLTREQHQKQKHSMSKSNHDNAFSSLSGAAKTSKATNTTKAPRNDYYSFAIYQGYSQLIEDFDEDGYFQTFSVTFDADAITSSIDDQFVVYAELYLSKNGGPWIHYYSTDDFVLNGESEDDIYEVYTTLEQGYPSDEYDVLIDLYETGYSDVVASYSSDDTNDLYALPLESSDYDPIYQPVYIIEDEHGGSNSIAILLSLLSLLLIRKIKAS